MRVLVTTTSATLEIGTGIALIATPALIIHMLFGVAIPGGGASIGRVCGIGLLALGLATLPRRNVETTRAVSALFVYNLLSSLYFGYLGASGQFAGLLLWPACFIHGLLTLLLAAPVYQDLRLPAK